MKNTNIIYHAASVTRERRNQLNNHRSVVIWFTGLSGSGKSSVAAATEKAIVASGYPAYLLDGDNLRFGLNEDLNFSAEDRHENVRRVSEVAKLFADAGLIALVPLISPYLDDRQRARELHDRSGLRFFEIFVDTFRSESQLSRAFLD